ncbi:MAG: hypothetical protein R8K22_01105 [Mariprofundaceae bacterium]
MLKKNYLPMQAGDVPEMSTDIQALMKDVGFNPDTSMHDDIKRFLDWYRSYYGA